MAGQSPAERLFTLTCCLMAASTSGLTKQSIFSAVPGYSDASTHDAREKMFDRDKTALRSAGVQLETVQPDPGDVERYVIAKGSFAWPKDFQLTPEQLGLVELAAKAWNTKQFATAARTALTRLKSRGAVEINRELSFIAPKLLVKHKAFAPLAEAIDENRVVLFDYRVPGEEARTREVKPLKLRLLSGEWVLLAQRGGEIRNYLLRRIVSKVKKTDLIFDPIDQDTVAKAELDLVAFTKGNVAVIEVVEDSEAWWHFGESNSIELNFMDEDLLAEDLMEFGGEVKVISPESLANRIRSRLERVVKIHA